MEDESRTRHVLNRALTTRKGREESEAQGGISSELRGVEGLWIPQFGFLWSVGTVAAISRGAHNVVVSRDGCQGPGR